MPNKETFHDDLGPILAHQATLSKRQTEKEKWTFFCRLFQLLFSLDINYMWVQPFIEPAEKRIAGRVVFNGQRQVRFFYLKIGRDNNWVWTSEVTFENSFTFDETLGANFDDTPGWQVMVYMMSTTGRQGRLSLVYLRWFPSLNSKYFHVKRKYRLMFELISFVEQRFSVRMVIHFNCFKCNWNSHSGGTLFNFLQNVSRKKRSSEKQLKFSVVFTLGLLPGSPSLNKYCAIALMNTQTANTMIQCSTLCTQRKVTKFPCFWCLVFGAQVQHYLEFFLPIFLLCS